VVNAGVSRVVLRAGVDPTALTSLRVTGAVCVLAMWAGVLRPTALRPPRGRRLLLVVVLGVVATGWYYLARDTGTDQTTATDSSSPSSDPVDVASKATAEAPKTAPPRVDVDGKQVTYDASNMLDGVPTTAWRMAGSGAGTTLTFTLAGTTKISSVGMVNGYAKTSTDDQGRTFDWYAGNRRVKAVVWGFDDGTKVRQQLEDKDRDLQSVDVDPVSTKKVTVKIVRVTNPGTGTSARNFTAISEVSLVGIP